MWKFFLKNTCSTSGYKISLDDYIVPYKRETIIHQASRIISRMHAGWNDVSLFSSWLHAGRLKLLLCRRFLGLLLFVITLNDSKICSRRFSLTVIVPTQLCPHKRQIEARLGRGSFLLIVRSRSYFASTRAAPLPVEEKNVSDSFLRTSHRSTLIH